MSSDCYTFYISYSFIFTKQFQLLILESEINNLKEISHNIQINNHIIYAFY